MTVEAYGQDQRNLAMAGMEDFDTSSLTVPRLRIDNDNGVFKNVLDGSTFDTFDGIVLGFVAQRIMWHPSMKDGDIPQCKSRNFQNGYPTLEADLERHKFPWGESNFAPANLMDDANGNKYLPCKACVFNQWSGTRKEPVPPRCAEQHTLILQGSEGENYLFTVQRTSLKPTKLYEAGFVQKGKPMFSRQTRMGIRMNGGSQRRWGTPTFEAYGETDPLAWDAYAEAYYRIRDFLTAAPRNKDGNEAQGDANYEAAATASTAVARDAEVAHHANANIPAPKAAAPIVVEATVESDDDLPF